MSASRSNGMRSKRRSMRSRSASEPFTRWRVRLLDAAARRDSHKGLGARKRGSRPSAPKSSRPSSDRSSLPVSGDTPRGDQGRSPRPAADGAERLSPDGPAKRPSGRDEALGFRRRRNRCMARVGVCAAYLRTTPNTVNPEWLSGIRRVRPAGIEPAACGLKDRCSLAPRREPLTTELRALGGLDASALQRLASSRSAA